MGQRTIIVLPARLTRVDGLPGGLSNWLLGRKVPLSPIAVDKADFSSGRVKVTPIRSNPRRALSIETDTPVSRQQVGPYLSSPLGFNVTT